MLSVPVCLFPGFVLLPAAPACTCQPENLYRWFVTPYWISGVVTVVIEYPNPSKMLPLGTIELSAQSSYRGSPTAFNGLPFV